jgi:hypothetical protein
MLSVTPFPYGPFGFRATGLRGIGSRDLDSRFRAPDRRGELSSRDNKLLHEDGGRSAAAVFELYIETTAKIVRSGLRKSGEQRFQTNGTSRLTLRPLDVSGCRGA